MDEELKKALAELGMTHKEAVSAQATALKDFRDTVEANDKKRDTVFDEKIAKLQAELDKFEPLNDAIVKAEARAKEQAEKDAERQDQLDRIEARMQRPGSGTSDKETEAQAYREAFFAHARYDKAAFNEERKNVLQVSDDTGAGYLAPPEFVLEILKEIVLISPMRDLVSVRTTGRRSVTLPHRKSIPSAIWVGETQQRANTEGLNYGLDDIPVHEATMAVPVSNAMLEDSEFNLEAEISFAVSQAFGVQEGQALISGNAVKKPQGFLNAAGTIGKSTGTAATLTADSLIDLKYALKTGYATNGIYVMNRQTLGAIRKLKDGDGQYLWASGLAAGQGNTIDGAPYAEMPDMPDIGAGTKPVAFGDWKRGYTLVDRLQMAMLRDQFTQAENGLVMFRWRRRLGGAVSIAEAIAVLTVQA